MLEGFNRRTADILETTRVASSAEAELEKTLLTCADTYVSVIPRNENHWRTRRRLRRFASGIKPTPSASATVQATF